VKIKRRYMPVLVVTGAVVGIGLALLLALLVGVGTASAEWCTEGYCCDRAFSPYGPPVALCEGPVTCWGPDILDYAGCTRATFRMLAPSECFLCSDGFAETSAGALAAVNPCNLTYECAGTVAKTGGSIWLADVCEPDDGFSANGEMTIDSNFPGPLKFGASFDGPWVEVEVNGPPWVVTEEMLESFAEMAGVEDWHDLWVRSGDGYPQYLGNMIIERDGRMDLLCAE
jgi:hypothetical protein